MYRPSPEAFSDVEMKYLEEGKMLTREYQICNRHSAKLRIPFDFLKYLKLALAELEEGIRIRTIAVRGRAVVNEESEVIKLMDMIDALLPQLQRNGRQEAANALASLVHALDNFVDSDDAERPSKKRRLEKTVGDMLQMNEGDDYFKEVEFQIKREIG